MRVRLRRYMGGTHTFRGQVVKVLSEMDCARLVVAPLLSAGGAVLADHVWLVLPSLGPLRGVIRGGDTVEFRARVCRYRRMDGRSEDYGMTGVEDVRIVR